MFEVLAFALIAPVATWVAMWSAKRWAGRRQLQGWQSLQAVRIIVNLKSGQSIDGYLVRQEASLLFLRDAVLIGNSDEPVPVDGQIIVEQSEIEFTQSP